VAGVCECGDEPSVFIKYGVIYLLVKDLLASQEGLCSTASCSGRTLLDGVD
jgi:hypothetical protein